MMKPIKNEEFMTLVKALTSLIGCRFQDNLEVDGRFIWTFWRADIGETQWALDLRARDPVILPVLSGIRFGKAKNKTPSGLFLNAHFVNKQLLEVQWQRDLGRVIRLGFTDRHYIEIRLFRGGANLILTTPGKSLSYAKPLELKPLTWISGGEPERDLNQIMSEYWHPAASKERKPNDPEEIKTKRIAKIQLAIERTESDLEEKSRAPWATIAKWIEENRSLVVSSEWLPFVDQRQGIFQNVQILYQKAKDNQEKIERIRLRLVELKSELEQTLNKPAKDFLPRDAKSDLSRNANEPKGKHRSLRLPTGHQIFVGRNGKENLEILRSSSAWDYWLHLRDYPSAHAVLRRNKGETLSDEILRQAISTFIRESFRSKINSKLGESFDVLIAELRYVKPIKGDKLGRVTYTNERILRIELR